MTRSRLKDKDMPMKGRSGTGCTNRTQQFQPCPLKSLCCQMPTLMGAFLKTDYDKKDIHIKMEGETVTLMEEIDPAYYKDFIYLYIHGRKCMYA